MLSPGGVPGEVPWGLGRRRAPSIHERVRVQRAGETRPLVPLLLTGVRHHPPGRTDKNLCRCFGAPACRVFPDHLITNTIGAIR